MPGAVYFSFQRMDGWWASLFIFITRSRYQMGSKKHERKKYIKRLSSTLDVAYGPCFFPVTLLIMPDAWLQCMLVGVSVSC